MSGTSGVSTRGQPLQGVLTLTQRENIDGCLQKLDSTRMPVTSWSAFEKQGVISQTFDKQVRPTAGQGNPGGRGMCAG